MHDFCSSVLVFIVAHSKIGHFINVVGERIVCIGTSLAGRVMGIQGRVQRNIP